jgi:selenocysteine-specific elongation factor
MAEQRSSMAPAARSVILGTAGHIDHGKTALVRALTGIDTDRLPEEKRRGITIDLGFASLETQACDGSTLRLSFVDVPGHARFVRNMLAGAAGIDAVLMVISAEEGVMPQTEEHLAICSLLSIERGITVLAKADAVSEERLLETMRAVRSFVRGTLLAGGPVLAVSAHSGSGIAELRRELIRLASGVPVRSPDAVFRLPIDRAFVMKGFGTVVTGTLIGGSVRAGDELAILPGGRTTRVRGVQVHGRPEEEAGAGSRVALNLVRIETAELNRGNILVVPSSVPAVDTLDIELSVLRGAPPLKHRARIHFHAFASECIATATLYDAASVGPGETELARLRLSEPMALLPDDRFVLRMGTPITTIGGGRILDAHPPAQVRQAQTRKAKTAEWLRKLHAASREERVWLRVARRGLSGVSPKELSRETGITEAALGGLIQRWIREDRVHLPGETCILTQESFAMARQTILEQLRPRSGADSSGVRRSELREQTGLDSDIFDDALRSLEQERQLQVAGAFVLPSAASGGSGHEHGPVSTLAEEYERAGITPPSPGELGMRLGIAPAEMRRLITLLLRDGRLVRLSDDSLCMHRRALETLTDKIRGLRGQTLDIATFKQLAGVSRKYAIPLLEYLDRTRITVKQGNQRLVL